MEIQNRNGGSLHHTVTRSVATLNSCVHQGESTRHKSKGYAKGGHSTNLGELNSPNCKPHGRHPAQVIPRQRENPSSDADLPQEPARLIISQGVAYCSWQRCIWFRLSTFCLTFCAKLKRTCYLNCIVLRFMMVHVHLYDLGLPPLVPGCFAQDSRSMLCPELFSMDR